jgi:hypothetical protein
MREYGGFTWLGWLVVAMCVLSILVTMGVLFRVF